MPKNNIVRKMLYFSTKNIYNLSSTNFHLLKNPVNIVFKEIEKSNQQRYLIFYHL